MREIRVDVTSSIESIVSRCLEKDIESRYQDADILAAQLDEEIGHYIIQPSKKLMCEFVKNPIQTTEKLRADRISKHTEKALYFMNQGQGRLADATRDLKTFCDLIKKINGSEISKPVKSRKNHRNQYCETEKVDNHASVGNRYRRIIDRHSRLDVFVWRVETIRKR
jgi:serine/threonine protein kinase